MEDVRITEIAAESFTLAENSAVPPHFRINVDHSGLSKFWRDAELQMFRLSQENSQANRSWRSTLYENGTIRTDGPSDAFVSLIKAFIPAAPSGSTVFATSSAWEDLNIYLRTSAAERPVLDTLVLRIVYTYRDQAPGKKSWRAHLLGQNQRIIAAYEKAGLGVPGGTVLAAGRNLLDLGYAPEAVARRAVELRSVEEVED